MADQLEQTVLSRVLEVARRLGVTADLNEILSMIIDAMRDLLHAERATVFEYDPRSNELFATVAHGLGESVDGRAADPGVIRFAATEGLAGAAAAKRRPIAVADAYSDPRFNPEVDRRTGFRTRSILSIPLMGFDDELIGVTQVLNKRGGAFTADDETIATALAAQAAVAIKRARLVQDQIARQRLERELELAREIQRRTFPSTLPEVPGYDIATWSESADTTGGDTHDVVGIHTPRHTVLDETESKYMLAVFVLADATGHGIGPALIATSMRSMIRMGTRLQVALQAVVDQLNRQLCDDLPLDRFITAWIARLDAERHTLYSLSAGQAPLLHFHAASGEVEVLGADAPPLGITPELDMDCVREIPLAPGDIFAVVSDGICEATNPRGAFFGYERVTKILQDAHKSSAQRIVDLLTESLNHFTNRRPPDDDRTVVLIKRANQVEINHPSASTR